MIDVIIWEHETSEPTRRELPIIHAHRMGQNGGFYKVQLVYANGVIDTEYKQGIRV